ncbi:MAG: flagellar biosynthesis anti-sigma factor FlgM [Deltaproteobacteria bacterium]|nr:flagellar biosynthesis anti-sigma factor FlgM [Deltaproteobacteria bacterium]
MKIDNITENIRLIQRPDEASSQRKEETHRESGSEPDKVQSPGTEVNLSSRSVEFSRAAEMMHRETAERAEKIEEIRARIAEGAYNVDSRKVADKIVEQSIAELMES